MYDDDGLNAQDFIDRGITGLLRKWAPDWKAVAVYVIERLADGCFYGGVTEAEFYLAILEHCAAALRQVCARRPFSVDGGDGGQG